MPATAIPLRMSQPTSCYPAQQPVLSTRLHATAATFPMRCSTHCRRTVVERRDRMNAQLGDRVEPAQARYRSEEHTSELQSLMRISYAVFCLKKKKPKR